MPTLSKPFSLHTSSTVSCYDVLFHHSLSVISPCAPVGALVRRLNRKWFRSRQTIDTIVSMNVIGTMGRLRGTAGRRARSAVTRDVTESVSAR